VLAEVAAVGAVPFVAPLNENVPGQAQQRGGVREGADHVGASFDRRHLSERRKDARDRSCLPTIRRAFAARTGPRALRRAVPAD
jgi:hypothetical protein